MTITLPDQKLGLPYIYMITDIRNGMRYVGQHNGKNKRYFASGEIISKIIGKHGYDNALEFLKKEIIVCGNLNEVLLDELEKHYVRLFATKYPLGYNQTDGGKGTVGRTEESIEKIRRSLLGHEVSKQTREKISNSLKGNIPWNKGAKGICKSNNGSLKKGEHRSIETEFKKGNKSNVGKKYTVIKDGRHGNSAKIIQLTISGDIVKIWPSISQMGREMGIKNLSPICSVAKGRQKTSHGFVWGYVDQNIVS